MHAPASELQRTIFHTSRQPGDSGRYRLALRWRFEGGRLDPAALERAAARLVDRHEALRTALVEHDDLVWQRVQPPWTPEVSYRDFGSLSAEAAEDAAHRWLDELHSRVQPLEGGRLLALALAETGPGRGVLGLLTHHAAVDGHSVRILLDDLDRALGGDVLEPALVQYRDAVDAERRVLAAGDAPVVDHWRRTLDSVPADCGLARPDRPGPDSTVCVPVAADAREWMTSARRRWRASPFAVLATALVVALHRTTGRDVVSIGFPSAGRRDALLEGVVGPCANMVPLVSRCGPLDQVATHVRTVSGTLADALDHDELSYDALLRVLRPERLPGVAPYVDVSLNLTVLSETRTVGPVTLERVPAADPRGESMFAVTAAVLDVTGPLRLQLLYRGDRVAAGEVRRLGSAVAGALDDLAEAPETLVLRPDPHPRTS